MRRGQLPMRLTTRRGYTLIELLITVAILGLASSIIIPALTDRGDLEVQAAVRMLVADIGFAQSDALAHQEYRRIHFYDDGRGWCLFRVTDPGQTTFTEASEDYIVDPMNSNDYIIDFVTDHRFKTVSVSNAEIDGTNRYVTFDALGGTVVNNDAPGTGGTISLTADGHTYDVTLSPFTGKITVAKQ